MKKIFINTALTLGSLTVLFIVLEIVFRIAGYSTYSIEADDSDYIQPDSILNYKYKSNLDINVATDNYSVRVRTNSLGYRDAEWTFSPNNKKILVIGNSFSAGYGVEEKQRWSDQLEVALNKTDSIYQVYNAAVSGYSLEQVVATESYLTPKIDPDFVILGLFIYGLNRLENPFVYFEGFNIRKDKLDYAKIHKDELFILNVRNPILQFFETLFLKNSVLYNFTINRLKVLKGKLFPPPPKDHSILIAKATSLLQQLHLNTQSENRQLIIIPILLHNRNFEFDPLILEDYHEIKAFCASNNIPFIDLLPILKKKAASKTDFWINDEPHWNTKAHKLAADLLFEEITNKRSEF